MLPDAMTASDRFVRVPTELVEALLKERLSGTQFLIVLWVIRQTLGWNRRTTPFSWYRIAVELAMDRGGVVRAGQRLLRSGLLYLENDEIGVSSGDRTRRALSMTQPKAEPMTRVSDDSSQRKPSTTVIANDDWRHLTRCQESSLFRRAKDNTKDKLKTKDRRMEPQGRKSLGSPAFEKYENLSRS
jgi:phage replication O-like protein O